MPPPSDLVPTTAHCELSSLTVPASHHMLTRRKAGVIKPNPRYANLAMADDVPCSVCAALHDPAWIQAMQEEYDALQHNRTWELVPHPSNAHVVSGKWIFKNKFHANGILERRKTIWVVRGISQRPGLDFDQTLSPVIKLATIRTVLHLAAAWD